MTRLTPELHIRYSASATQRASRLTGTPLGSGGLESQLNSVTQNWTGRPEMTFPALTPASSTRFICGRSPMDDIVRKVRMMRRPSRRVRVMCPDVEMDLLAALRLKRRREAKQLTHEGEWAPLRIDLHDLGRDIPERRRTSCNHDVVLGHRLHAAREFVDHRAVEGRRIGAAVLVLRIEELRDVRLVPRLPVADSRKTRESAAVTPSCGGRELTVLDRVRSDASVGARRAAALRPVRSGIDR